MFSWFGLAITIVTLLLTNVDWDKKVFQNK